MKSHHISYWTRLLILSSIIATTLTLALTGLSPHAKAAEVYFSDGFESGNTSKWIYNNVDQNGSTFVQTSVAHNGTHAVALQNTWGPGQLSYLYTSLNGAYTETYTRFYVYFSTLSGLASGSEMAMGRDVNNHNIWEVNLSKDIPGGLEIYFWDGQNHISSIVSQANVLTANTWYSIEVHINSATDGRGEVWLNGNSIGAVTGDFSVTYPHSRLMLFDRVAHTAYYDDVVVSDTYNGPATTGPEMGLSTNSIDYGNQALNVGSTHNVTVTNVGSAVMNIGSIGISGTNASDFSQSNTCGSSLAPGGSCVINVTFTPPTAGNRSATLSIPNNAPGSPHTVALTGKGVNSTSYLSDDFETGNFNKWIFNNSDSTGSATVQTTTVNSGTHAASLSNSTGQYCYIYTPLATAVSESYTRFYFRLTSATVGTDIAIGRNNNGGNTWEMVYNQNTHAIETYIWGNGGQIYVVASPANSVQADTWYSVELSLDQSASGSAQLWLNNTSVSQITGDLSTANPYGRLMFFNASSNAFFIDDVDVSAAYNGPVA